MVQMNLPAKQNRDKKKNLKLFEQSAGPWLLPLSPVIQGLGTRLGAILVNQSLPRLFERNALEPAKCPFVSLMAWRERQRLCVCVCGGGGFFAAPILSRGCGRLTGGGYLWNEADLPPIEGE